MVSNGTYARSPLPSHFNSNKGQIPIPTSNQSRNPNTNGSNSNNNNPSETSPIPATSPKIIFDPSPIRDSITNELTFEKGIFIAIRNTDDEFFLAKTLQAVNDDKKPIKIR